jgi:hypothetical protein
MDALVLGRLEADRVDRAPLLVVADQAGLDRDVAGTLRTGSG